MARLATLILAHSPYDGRFDLPMPGLHTIRLSCTPKELMHGVAEPGLCIVAQGVKKVLLGSEGFEYDAARMLVYSVDVPVAFQVTQASKAEPFLCLKLDLDPQTIADLALRVYPDGLPPAQRNLAVSVTQVDPDILQAATKLMELLDQPFVAGLLAPLVVEEILIRLLLSPIGGRVAQIGQPDSRLHQVSKAVTSTSRWMSKGWPRWCT
jgi:hypothetical protein